MIRITFTRPDDFPGVTFYRFSLDDDTGYALETTDDSEAAWHITTPTLGLTELPVGELLGLHAFLHEALIAGLLRSEISDELSPITISREMEIIDDETSEALPLTRYSLGDLSLDVYDTPDSGTGNDLYFNFPHVFDAIPRRAQLRMMRTFLTSPEISAIIDGPDPKRPERKGAAQ